MEQKLGFLNILRLIVNSSILTLFEMSRIVVDFAKHFVIATIALTVAVVFGTFMLAPTKEFIPARLIEEGLSALIVSGYIGFIYGLAREFGHRVVIQSSATVLETNVSTVENGALTAKSVATATDHWQILADELYEDMLKNINQLIKAIHEKSNVQLQAESTEDKDSIILDYLRIASDDQIRMVSGVVQNQSTSEMYAVKQALTVKLWLKLDDSGKKKQANTIPLDRATAKRIALKRTFIFAVVALIAISISVTGFAFLASQPGILMLTVGVILGMLAIYGAIYGLKLIYEVQFEELVRKSSPSVWLKNTGLVPPDSIVNVQHADGTVAWRISPKEKDWSLDAENPIKEYMRANDNPPAKFRV